MDPVMSENLIDPEEAAGYLSIDVETLLQLARQRRISCYRISSKTFRFRRSDLDAWKAAGFPLEPLPMQGPRVRNRAASHAHEDAIDRLVPDAQRTGYFDAMLVRFGIELSDWRVVPDAFAFDDVAHVLTVYEVEHTHPNTKTKLRRLRALRVQLTERGWSIRLLVAASSDREWTEVDITTGEVAPHEWATERGRVRFDMPGEPAEP